MAQTPKQKDRAEKNKDFNAVLKRMLNTPPTPHKQTKKNK